VLVLSRIGLGIGALGNNNTDSIQETSLQSLSIINKSNSICRPLMRFHCRLELSMGRLNLCFQPKKGVQTGCLFNQKVKNTRVKNEMEILASILRHNKILLAKSLEALLILPQANFSQCPSPIHSDLVKQIHTSIQI
jgi:hypothetical protein